jgi:hypothetical protein
MSTTKSTWLIIVVSAVVGGIIILFIIAFIARTVISGRRMENRARLGETDVVKKRQQDAWNVLGDIPMVEADSRKKFKSHPYYRPYFNDTTMDTSEQDRKRAFEEANDPNKNAP